MKQINFKLKIALVVMINFVSVVSLVWILNFQDNQSAKAETGKYSAVWTPTKCRVAVSGATKVSIGPAGWKVVYTLADGTSITEIWEVTDWVDNKYGVTSYETQLADSKVCKKVQGYRTGAIYTAGLYSVTGDAQNSTWISGSFPARWVMAQQ